jgi:hypothetical protein
MSARPFKGVRGHYGRHEEHRREPVRLRRGRQGSRQGRLARPEMLGESHAGEGREVQVRHQERRGDNTVTFEVKVANPRSL